MILRTRFFICSDGWMDKMDSSAKTGNYIGSTPAHRGCQSTPGLLYFRARGCQPKPSLAMHSSTYTTISQANMLREPQMKGFPS